MSIFWPFKLGERGDPGLPGTGMFLFIEFIQFVDWNKRLFAYVFFYLWNF